MATPPQLAAPTQANGSPPEDGAAGDPPLDLTTLSLEELLALRVGDFGQFNSDDVRPDDALDGLATSPVLANMSHGAGASGGELDESPLDLTALSLAELTNLRID